MMLRYLLLLLLVQYGDEQSIDLCPSSCDCTEIKIHGIAVNCSSRRLTSVPDLPMATVRLFLQNNLLTTVLPGTFDHLEALQEVDVSGNPWNCDCNILYLKAWLDSQPVQINTGNVRCASPTKKAFQNLTGNEFPSCGRQWPINCKSFFVRDLYMNGLAVVVLILMSYVARMARNLACRVAVSTRRSHNISTKESFKSK
ncbi:platelet glycoprotein IX-like [Hyperolius riggenbachi]|uniref:platelet glycoprotein IX-like n=1 Tax=Hyperolius riggenbachi TaxID=752182 RepID=UPI0035A2DFED